VWNKLTRHAELKPNLLAGLCILAALSTPGLCWAEAMAESGVMTGVDGCEVAYEDYRPVMPATGATVILAHGFQRDLSTMRGWAEHWSAAGLRVVIPSLCNSSWFSGRHDRNAADLQAIRRHLEIGPVIYAGFSAGGLAAYLASLDDPETVAYLGLDAVDSGDLAAARDEGLAVPALFLLAESSACNAKNNFLPVIKRHKAYVSRRIKDATHCHFEMPYDSRCGWLCGRRDEAQTVRQQSEIRDAATRWILSAP
jgi:pimeloyl-ACP methyl ester carboxylesterase